MSNEELLNTLAYLKIRKRKATDEAARRTWDISIRAVVKLIAVEPIVGNEVCSADGIIYGVPTCPSCKEVTYSQEWCPFCGQHLIMMKSMELPETITNKGWVITNSGGGCMVAYKDYQLISGGNRAIVIDINEGLIAISNMSYEELSAAVEDVSTNICCVYPETDSFHNLREFVSDGVITDVYEMYMLLLRYSIVQDSFK